MRWTLGSLALLLALAGCGDDDATSGSDTPTPSPDVPAATLVHGTAAGGEDVAEVTVLADDTAVAEYARQFRGSLPEDVTRAAGQVDVPAGHQLVAAVVSIGCDVPPGVEVSGSGQDVTFTPHKVPSPLKECLAPVTTVALAAVPA